MKAALSWLRTDRGINQCFFLLVLLYFVLSISALNLTPTVMLDEVDTISQAEATFPTPPYLASWERSDGTPFYTFTWGYSLAMRPFVALFGLSPTAARLPALLAGLIVALLMRRLLLALSVRSSIASLAALLLLTSSPFSQSLHRGRADTMALAWALGALLLASKAPASPRPIPLLSAAGICMVVSLATWPSAWLVLFLVPVSLLWTSWPGGARSTGRAFLALTVSALAAVAITVTISLWSDGWNRISAARMFVAVGTAGSVVSSLPQFVVQVAGFFGRQPWMLVIIAVSFPLSVLFPTRRGLTCAAVSVVTLVLATRCHFHSARFLYCLPALLLTFAFGLETIASRLESRNYHQLKHHILAFSALTMLASLITEPGIRTAHALANRQARNYGRVDNFLSKKIKVNERVFGCPLAFYAVKNARADFRSFFVVMRHNVFTIYDTRSIRQQVNPGGSLQLLGQDPACIGFLRKIDWVITDADMATGHELTSADRSVRFVKVAELPSVRGRFSRPTGGAEGYSLVLFRRL